MDLVEDHEGFAHGPEERFRVGETCGFGRQVTVEEFRVTKFLGEDGFPNAPYAGQPDQRDFAPSGRKALFPERTVDH